MKVKLNIRLDEELIERFRRLEKDSLIRLAVHVDLALKKYLEEYDTRTRRASSP